MNLILITIFIGNLNITGYRSVPEQTDNSPFHTATGERVCRDGIAVSQDMLVKNGGTLRFGDWLWVEGIGFRRINDVMNKRHKKSIDIWCETKEEESMIWQKFRGRKVRVWVISRSIKGEEVYGMR